MQENFEGGLGFKHAHIQNKALFTNLIWHFFYLNLLNLGVFLTKELFSLIPPPSMQKLIRIILVGGKL